MTAIEKMRNKGIVPKAALYARFSSDNQREESIEAQLRALHEYCQRSGIVVVKEYCDRARSATTDDRPEFLHLIEDSQSGDFDFAIVHKLDRFSRNRYDSAYYKRELKKSGVSLVSVLENLDDSPESIILESVLEGMSEYYSKNLSREVMKGMRESALKCQAVGGRPPYGYKVNQTTRKFEINENEADAVRFVFKSVCDGIGYSEIITELNHLGYRTRLNNPFGKNSLTEILRNERYKGIYIFNRAISHNQSGKRNNHRSKPEDEVIRIPGGMPAIVDTETFDRVAEILKGRTHKTVSRNAKENYMLIGKIVCGICGASYTGNRQTSGRNKTLLVTYRCIKRGNHGDRHCTNKDINRNYIEDFVFKRVGETIFNEKRIPQLIKAYYVSSGEISGNVANKLKSLRVNLTSVEQKISNVISVITKTGSPSLLETLDTLESEKQVLTLQISNEEDNMIANKLNEKEIIAAYHMAQALYGNGTIPERRQLLNLYLKRILVYPEYVEFEMNNVPSNLLTPAQNNASPVDTDEPCALHNLIKIPFDKTKSRLNKSDGTWDFVVEARGEYPLSFLLFSTFCLSLKAFISCSFQRFLFYLPLSIETRFSDFSCIIRVRFYAILLRISTAFSSSCL